MNTAELIEAEAVKLKTETCIHLPLGLLGFEQVKKYLLISSPEEHPFLWLQMVGEMDRSFLVIPPSFVKHDYQPEISQEDVKFLGLQSADEAVILNIVTLKEGGRAFANLKGPIVINKLTGIARQIIPMNSWKYGINHPLPVEE
jgi:flagellar assembly factor FliW